MFCNLNRQFALLQALVMQSLERARVQAILGCCPKSVDKVNSGNRAYLRFLRGMMGPKVPAYPPLLEVVMAWSHTFRCHKTWIGYLGYLRIGCALARAAQDVFDHPDIARATTAIMKRELFTPREKLFIRMPLLQHLVIISSTRQEWKEVVLPLVAAYGFTLRLTAPSEVLPVAVQALSFLCVCVSTQKYAMCAEG